MIEIIKKTMQRLSGRIFGFNPVEYYPKLLEGLAAEHGRVRQYKDKVLSAVVVNDQTDPDMLNDLNKKYGIPVTLSGTDQEKIDRIIERATPTGYPGPEWLQEQLQKAGYELYVHENTAGADPAGIEGELIVGSPPFGIRRLANGWGIGRWGVARWGAPNPPEINPRPYVYERGTDPIYWVCYFTLSPFPDRLAVDDSEFLETTAEKLDYLKRLIIELKPQSRWCILQAKAV